MFENCRGHFHFMKQVSSYALTQYFKGHALRLPSENRQCCFYMTAAKTTTQQIQLYKRFNVTTSQPSVNRKFVLGIETSCDDTGAAVVDNEGSVIGEAMNSQTAVHNLSGGIIPNVARELHEKNVEGIVKQALENAEMTLNDLDAIAVTVEPGLIMSLRAGMRHAQKLAKLSGKPLIPIHHMEAHALTARMIHKVEFPFMVLLASGGHCLLAVAQDIDDFLLLGTSCDIAPGDAFDKTARELKLWSLPKLCGMSGGAAVEHMARQGDAQAFPPVYVSMKQSNCNFSFSGLLSSTQRKIQRQYANLDLPIDLPEKEVLPNAGDICAWFQYNVTYHICRKLQRALIYSEMNELLGKKKTLVVSGGVASNSFIRACLQRVCSTFDCELICPPPKLCTDNGIMIAWNGMEKLLSGCDFSQDPDSVDVTARSPLGNDFTDKVSNCKIKLPKLILVDK